MRDKVIIVKSCRRCPLRSPYDDGVSHGFMCIAKDGRRIDRRTITFPKFCPLPERKQ